LFVSQTIFVFYGYDKARMNFYGRLRPWQGTYELLRKVTAMTRHVWTFTEGLILITRSSEISTMCCKLYANHHFNFQANTAITVKDKNSLLFWGEGGKQSIHEYFYLPEYDRFIWQLFTL